MITLTINKKQYQIKTDLKDFTIGEFEDYMALINFEDQDQIDRYVNIFKITEEDEKEMETSEFLEAIATYTKAINNNFMDLPKINEIELNNTKYICYGEKFSIKVNEFKLINKYIKTNKDKFIAYIMAILFKDENLTANEHYDPAHLKFKMELFRDKITADVAFPYTCYFTNQVVTSLSSMNENPQ